MIPNPTDEIKAIRRKLAAKFDNDVHRIAEDLRLREMASGRTYVSLPSREPARNQKADKALPPTTGAPLFEGSVAMKATEV